MNEPTAVSNVADDCSPSGKKKKHLTNTAVHSRALPATAQLNKKQPKIDRALRRAQTLKRTWAEAAPKVKRSGIAPDSSGKVAAPHNLEGGSLASRNAHISKKRRRELDSAFCSQKDANAGSSEQHAVLID